MSTRSTTATLSLLGASIVAVATGASGCRSTASPDAAWSTRHRSVESAGHTPETLAVMRAGSARDAALTLLLQAAESSSPLLRANAVEGLGATPSEARLAIQRALGDSNRGVRFVGAMSVALMDLGDLAPLLEPLLRDDSASVRAAAILALHRFGRRVDQTPLAAMIRSDDPEIRGNAAIVLGEIGNPSAIPLLQSALGRGMRLANSATVRIVELQIAEAQVRLGDPSAIDPIRAALFAPPEQAEIVALAAQICGRLNDLTSVPFLRQLVGAHGVDQRPAEIRLAAAAALGRMGQATPELLSEVIAVASDPQPGRRAQAAATLGALGDRRGLETAARLLNDSDPVVQVAAAGAILRLTD